jgi:threonylcarbamoyladenosine tRNA methylthiotransferase MtaB
LLRTAVYTLGCKLNQCESEALADAFSANGFQIVAHTDSADLYIVNTCTVTTKAEQKARRMIRKFASSQNTPLVIITGCYAEMDPDDLKKLPGSIIIVPLIRKPAILQLPQLIKIQMEAGMTLTEAVSQWAAEPVGSDADVSMQPVNPFSYKAVTFQYHARAFLKIEDGCDNACSYCRVTLARGKAVSLSQEEAVNRALDLERRGYREIVLTGVNITAYRSQGEGLEGLLRVLLGKLSTSRIRLSSLEPDMISDDLAELCRHPLVQPHFHIPVQSGSDRIIRSVNRNYTSRDIAATVARLRAVKDDPFIAADIITGLPMEQDKDAEETFELMKTLDFSQIHVFPFSPRPGTDLYEVGNRVTEFIRDKRAAELRQLSMQQHAAYIERWKGKVVNVLLEQEKSGYWTGLSGNYLHLQIHGVPETGLAVRGRVCRAVMDIDKGGKCCSGKPAGASFVDFSD